MQDQYRPGILALRGSCWLHAAVPPGDMQDQHDTKKAELAPAE